MSDTLLILDLETTGLDATRAGIVEIGCVAIRGGEIVGGFSSCVWPGRRYLTPAHREVLRISGITLEELIDAPPLNEVAEDLVAWADRLTGATAHCVTSYNVSFDRAFWEAHAPEVARERFAWASCVMERAAIHAGRLITRRLSLRDACDRLNISRDRAHRALDDAKSAAKVWLALEARG